VHAFLPKHALGLDPILNKSKMINLPMNRICRPIWIAMFPSPIGLIKHGQPQDRSSAHICQQHTHTKKYTSFLAFQTTGPMEGQIHHQSLLHRAEASFICLPVYISSECHAQYSDTTATMLWHILQKQNALHFHQVTLNPVKGYPTSCAIQLLLVLLHTSCHLPLISLCVLFGCKRFL
jgi:hypothetical protein